MLNAAERHQVDVVVVRDETRLGGDVIRTGLLIQDILDTGVKLVYYFTDEVVTLDDATAKFMVSARNYAAQLEREKISQRTHEHLLTKARRGYIAGGRVYGYDNHDVTNGDQRTHVEYRINEEQAAVLKEIFTRYALGEGLRSIAKGLNARTVPPPRAGKSTRSWSPSCIHAMLRRERYRGTIVWDQYEKTYKGGTKIRIERPECEWLRIEAPHLRIIDDDLWNEVQARCAGNAISGRRATPGRPPKYLLSGLARCGQCGGPLSVISGKDGNRAIKVYACAHHRERGEHVCANALRRPVEGVNAAVAEWIRANVLSEDLLVATLREIRRRLRNRTQATNQDLPQWQEDAVALRTEIANLVSAVAQAKGQAGPLVEAIGDRQTRLSSLEARINAAKAAPDVIDMETRRMEAEAKKRLTDLRGLLDRNQEEGRRVIAAVFDGSLTATLTDTPEGKRYRLEGKATFGGIVALSECVSNSASPGGTSST